MKKLLFLCLIILFFSCRHTAISSGKNVTGTTLQTENISRFTVSFISIGSGTDKNARKTFLDYLNDYEVKNKKKLIFEVVPWGREGETDYCFKLAELKEGEQTNFIKNIKELLKQFKLVRYRENTACKNRQK